MRRFYKSQSVIETNNIAKEIAKELRDKKGIVVGLTGELGAGKTTFTKAFLNELGVKNKTTSPTFIIMRQISYGVGEKRRKVYHIDAYRIDCDKDLEGVGIKKAIEDKNGVSIIEWADKIKNILPSDTIWINFEYNKHKHERNITIN